MNKVKKIKAYLERRIAEIRDISQGYIADKQMSTEYLLLLELLSYIDSLSDTEKDFGIKNSDLEEACDEYYDETWDEHGGKAMVVDGCHDIWFPSQATDDFFKAGAQWQKKQDQLTIELAEDHAYLAGQEKIIDKAIKWLEDNIDRYLYNTGGYGEYIPKCGGKMFEDLKKAMEE